MEPSLNLVRGNTSLQLSSSFLVGGRLTRMVDVRMRVSRSRIHRPGRIVQVESEPDVFAFQLPLSDLFPDRLRRLQVERMLSHVGHPDRSDTDFWTEQISSYAFHVANAVVFRSCSSASMAIELNISTEQFSDFREVEPVIDEEFLLSMIEPVGTQGGEFGAVPASTSSIQGLGKKRYRGDGKDGSTCAVCLEDFEAGDELTVMPCSHEFHQSCAAKWLEQSKSCPLCRSTMPTID